MKNTLFCFGLGYSAMALADSLSPSDWRITGTSRETATPHSATSRQWEIFPFDGTRPLADFVRATENATHILSSIPPTASGDPVIAAHGADIAAMKNLKWVGYLSTTGVYGDRQGGEVDEHSDRIPASERGRRRVQSEDAWLALWREHGMPVHIFRLAGIYGPGRNAIETVRQGRARRIHRAGQVFGRIHIDDIVQTLIASINRPNPGAAYNLTDDEPAPPDEVIAYACGLLGVEPPPIEEFDEIKDTLSPMARSFYGESKRVSNLRIKEELGVRLKWPNYREGLAGLL
jgi:nucleoside-diphosphate-sugar epimerase